MSEIAKNFDGCIVIIVMMNFHKNFAIAKIFPSRFPGIFTNIFQCKIIPVYSKCLQPLGSIAFLKSIYMKLIPGFTVDLT